jgi:hypothetical protein
MKQESREDLSIYWQEHIDNCRQSGLSQAAYCRKNQLKPHRYSYWKRQLTKSSQPINTQSSGFIKLNTVNSIPLSTPNSSLCVRLPNEAIIEGISEDNLHLVLPLVKQLS